MMPPRGRANDPLSARRAREETMAVVLACFSILSILMTVGIVTVLLSQAIGFFREASIFDFLTATRWMPFFEPRSFGVLPLLTATILITGIATIVAAPLGLLTAIHLSEYAHARVRHIIKPALEILAGIPTVVYGYFALTTITPLLRLIWPDTSIFNALSAAIVVGIMITPMVSSLSEDALNAVPQTLREGAYALGATKFEVTVRTVMPAAASGILASVILAMARAVGETMIVTIAAGATPKLTLNPLESVQTMTSYIAQVSLGETARGTLQYKTMFAVGLLLFVITLFMNIASNAILRRYREVYE